MQLKLPKTRGMLRREAASWLARLQSNRDPDIRRKFRRWHDSDPDHAEAFGRVSRSYEQAALLRCSPEIEAGSNPEPQHARISRRRYAIAAAAAILVLASAGLNYGRHFPFRLERTEAVMLATKVGEIRRVSLDDGSKVILDSATSLEVELGHSARRARLKSGRARFEIAPGATPFLVEAGPTIVASNRGTVDIERAGAQSRIEVLAGTADVRQGTRQPLRQTTIGSGQAITSNSAGFAKEILPTKSDWTRGMLQFDDTPLADAVALANRYSDRHIILGPDLNGLRVAGAFRTGDTAGLAKALAAAFSLSLQQRDNGDMILSRTALPANESSAMRFD